MIFNLSSQRTSHSLTCCLRSEAYLGKFFALTPMGISPEETGIPASLGNHGSHVSPIGDVHGNHPNCLLTASRVRIGRSISRTLTDDPGLETLE